MRCELCWKLTKCPCRWWGCPECRASNRQVSVQNTLIKMWLTKQEIRENREFIWGHTNKVEEITMFEYIRGVINDEQLQEEMDKYNPAKQKAIIKKPAFVPREWNNPTKQHEFDWDSPRSHCVWCGWLKKYVANKDCTKYKWEENEEK